MFCGRNPSGVSISTDMRRKVSLSTMNPGEDTSNHKSFVIHIHFKTLNATSNVNHVWDSTKTAKTTYCLQGKVQILCLTVVIWLNYFENGKKKTTLCFSRCVGKTLDCESAVATERLERCFHLFLRKLHVWMSAMTRCLFTRRVIEVVTARLTRVQQLVTERAYVLVSAWLYTTTQFTSMWWFTWQNVFSSASVMT